MQCPNKFKVWYPKAYIIQRNLRKANIYEANLQILNHYILWVNRGKSNWFIFAISNLKFSPESQSLHCVPWRDRELTNLMKTIQVFKGLFSVFSFWIKIFKNDGNHHWANEQEGWGFYIVNLEMDLYGSPVCKSRPLLFPRAITFLLAHIL